MGWEIDLPQSQPDLLHGLSNILVVAPHADDETLGVGATMSRFVAEGRRVTVAVMTGRGAQQHPLFADSAFKEIQDEFRDAMAVLGVENYRFANLPTTLLTETPLHAVNRVVSDLIGEIQPDLVFLPFEHDLHKDHGILSYAFRVALRPHLERNRRPHAVLSYEVPTETHLQPSHIAPAFDPTLWIDATDHIDRKCRAFACFKSQISPEPGLRSLSAVSALARWRGAQIGVPAAEAFAILRMVV